MADVNRFTLIGRVGAEVDFRQAPDKTAVAKIRLATTKTWRDAQKKRHERTIWHQVVLFGKLAEFARDYITKGREVFVEGEIDHETYKDATTGEERHVTKLYGHVLQPCGPKPAADQPGKPAPVAARPTPPAPPAPPKRTAPTVPCDSSVPSAEVNPFPSDPY